MTATRWLQVASFITLLFAVGHSVGGLSSWSPMGDNEVLKAMTTVKFETFGVTRAYVDLYLGFGWTISVALLLQTAVLWQLAILARTDLGGVRPIIIIFAFATAASGLIASRYIFPVPALFSFALLLPLVAAYMAAG